MFSNKTLALTLSIAALCTTTQTLEAQSIRASRTISYGNSTVGGVLALNGGVARTATRTGVRITADGSLDADVRVFGVRRSGIDFTANALVAANTTVRFRRRVTTLSASGNVAARINGRTVWSGSARASRTFVTGVVPTSVSLGAAARQTIGLGPISVTAQAFARAGADWNLNMSLSTASQTASLNGSVNGFARGGASVAVGIPGFTAGVSGRLEILDGRVAVNANATPTSRRFSMSWSLDALASSLRAFARGFGLNLSVEFFRSRLLAIRGSIRA